MRKFHKRFMKFICILNQITKIHLHQFLSRTGLFKSKAEIAERVKKGEFIIDDKPVAGIMYRFNPEKRKNGN